MDQEEQDTTSYTQLSDEIQELVGTLRSKIMKLKESIEALKFCLQMTGEMITGGTLPPARGALCVMYCERGCEYAKDLKKANALVGAVTAWQATLPETTKNIMVYYVDKILGTSNASSLEFSEKSLQEALRLLQSCPILQDSNNTAATSSSNNEQIA